MPSRPERVREAVLVLGIAIGTGWGCRAEPSAVQDAPIRAVIRLGETDGPTNRRLLGSNIQWVDRGDELLNADGTDFDPEMLELVTALGPTVLRYPGGSLTDTFDWRAGTGPARDRRSNERFGSRERQTVLFGTDELLRLCQRLGAEPLITVNAATGSPEAAADWVRAVNGASGTSGRVHYWEIGNEPYLREDARPEVAVAPSTYADRANRFIRAMRGVDPTISIGVPFRRDRLGTMPAVTFPGFADTVTDRVNERFDFVSLHNAYLPFVVARDAEYTEDELFRASMAAYRVVEEDLGATRRLLDRRDADTAIPFAITEYNAMYSLSGSYDDFGPTLGGALYVADLLRLLASRDDILMANYWSLSGNGRFGAVSNQGIVRPAYEVLRAYNEILRGQRLATVVGGPTFDSPAIGAVPAMSGVPSIVVTATSDGDHRRVIVINKAAGEPADVTVDTGAGGLVRAGVARELWDSRIFAPAHERGTVRWRDIAATTTGSSVRVVMAPHSLLWLDLEVR